MPRTPDSEPQIWSGIDTLDPDPDAELPATLEDAKAFMDAGIEGLGQIPKEGDDIEIQDFRSKFSRLFMSTLWGILGKLPDADQEELKEYIRPRYQQLKREVESRHEEQIADKAETRRAGLQEDFQAIESILG